MTEIKIFSKRVATLLIGKGHNLLRTEDNRKDKKFLVFIFQDSGELRKDLTNISNK